MRFAFTEDQLLFRDAVRDALAKEAGPDHLRAAWEAPTAAPFGDRKVWSTLADMGVLGLTVPEAHGGMGMNELDLVLLLEETGRVALPEPIVETVAVAAPLLAAVAPAELQAEWLPRIAAGDAVIAYRSATQPLVLGADAADLLIVDGGDGLVAVPGHALHLERQTSVDGARRLFAATWTPSDAVVLGPGSAAATAFDRGALGSAAQLLGLAQHLLDVTVGYVKQREQFGVPIGSFQAVKHHLADALLQLEFARPVVYRAAYSMAHGLDTRSRDVSMAKCYASDAATFVARQALQCHGAIAYTVEYDLHLWMKRVWALSASWGDAAFHRERVAIDVLGS